MNTSAAIARSAVICTAACLASCETPEHRGETVMQAEPVYLETMPSVEGGTIAQPRWASASLNSVARLLAGLGDDGAGATTAWPHHQQRMDAMWRSHNNGRGGEIRSWAAMELADLQQYGTVFYPFSGPDFLFAHEIFPNANTYILCGLETAEMLPDMATLSPGEMAAALESLRGSLTDLTNAGYFVSKDMRASLQATRLRGVLPILLCLLARTGHSITSVEPVGGEGKGLLVRFRSASGSGRRLFYFTQDLSNSGVREGGAFLNFVSSQGRSPALVKSASYLMHQNSFSNIRGYLLRHSAAIVQDPSGVPYRDLVAAGWNLRLYGNYQSTLDIFSQQQPDLAEAYQSRRHPVQPLTFGFGYLFHPSRTSIIVARR